MNASIGNLCSGKTNSSTQLRGKFARRDGATESRNRFVLFFRKLETLANKNQLNPGWLAYLFNVVETRRDVAIIVAALSAFTVEQTCIVQ